MSFIKRNCCHITTLCVLFIKKCDYSLIRAMPNESWFIFTTVKRHMNNNVHIQNWYSKARYNTFSCSWTKERSTCFRQLGGPRFAVADPQRLCYDTDRVKCISSFWYSLIVAVGEGLKCQQDNTITGGVSQSMKHLQRSSLAPWDRSDVQDQLWDIKCTYGVKANLPWIVV